MSYDSDVATKLARLERRTRVLSLGLLLMTAVATLGFVAGAPSFAGTVPGIDVITARGLVIVDAANRPRVVIGAPAGTALQDERLGASTGLVVLDTAGRLGVAVGNDPPLILEDGTVGRRIASSNGLVFYDPRDGKERGGVGAFADGRANVCLDYGNAQKEAACMTVAPDDQYAAVLLNGTPREEAYDRVGMFLGSDGVGVLKAFGGLNSADGVSIVAGGGMPTITVYDSVQAEVADLVERGLRP
jgi:hypothetical protein